MLPWGPTASINFDPRNTVQCPQIDQQLHRTPDWGLIGMRVYTEDIPLVELMYFVFTRMPGESYRRRLRSLLCLCDVVLVLIKSPVWWLFKMKLVMMHGYWWREIIISCNQTGIFCTIIWQILPTSDYTFHQLPHYHMAVRQKACEERGGAGWLTSQCGILCWRGNNNTL